MKKTRTPVSNFRLAVVAITILSFACNKDVKFAGQGSDASKRQIQVDQSFPAATIGDTTLKYKPMYGLVEEQLTLKEKGPMTTTLKQVARAAMADDFVQGHDGKAGSDQFTIASAGKLDMVVVIDDSTSMTSYQQSLAANLQSLLQYVGKTDWQLVVTTSTLSEPCLQTDTTSNTTVLTKAQYMADATGAAVIFQSLVNGATSSTRQQGLSQNDDQDNERVLYGALRALDYTKQATDSYFLNEVGTSTTQAPCKQINWVRPDSSIAILAVSDEDNCHLSTDASYHHSSVNASPPAADHDFQPNPSGPDGCSKDEYNGTTLLNYLSAAAPAGLGRTIGVNARFYAIYWRTGDPDYMNGGCGSPSLSRNSGSNQGWAYDNLIAATKGTYGDLCSPFTTTLDTISSDVASIIKRTFTLTETPANQTLVVTVDGQATTDYTLNGTTLTLTNPSAMAKTLSATYLYNATPKFEQVTLSQKPADGTLAVEVNGTALDPSVYTYDPVANDVFFMNQPADDAKVHVTYREGGTLPASFDTSAMQISGVPTAVSVNGQAVTAYHFDPSTHQLAFTDAPPDGASVAVTYRQLNDQITTYPETGITDTADVKSVSAHDATTKAPVALSESGTDLVFDPADVVDGRVVDVDYDYGDPKTALTHQLADPPIEGSVTVAVDDGSPNCVDSVTVAGQQVSFTCDADKIGEVAISYKYVAEQYTTFTVTQTIPDGAEVMVYVDGQAISDYTQNGQDFVVPQNELKITSTVRIVASVLAQ